MEMSVGASALRYSWDWSGFHMAYTYERDGLTNLYVTNDDGSTCTRLAAGTTSTFAWSPDGTRLAYLTKEQRTGRFALYTVRADGSNLRRVTSDRTLIGPPIWSPDGLRLAFTTTDFPGPTVLHTAWADGTGLVQIDTGSLIADFTWSPDGSRIAYLVSAGAFELRCAFADGTGRRALSGAGEVRTGGIAWSPDGSRLLYRADEDTPGIVALYSASPGGTDRLCLSGDPEPGRQVLDGFTWSPDGLHVAYRVARSSEATVELWTTHRDGGAPYRISGELADDWIHSAFAWSPDGLWLAFRTTDERLIMFDPASRAFAVIDRHVAPGFVWAPVGEHLAYLTTSGVLHTAFAASGLGAPIAASHPGFVWSPDGDALLFISDALYTADIDGGSVSLVSRLGLVGAPMWSPSGDRIAFGAQGLGSSVELYLAWPQGGAIPITCREP
jgi:Tol biopolymer transport system component